MQRADAPLPIRENGSWQRGASSVHGRRRAVHERRRAAGALVAAPLTPSLNLQHGVQVGDLHLERSLLGEWRRRRVRLHDSAAALDRALDRAALDRRAKGDEELAGLLRVPFLQQKAMKSLRDRFVRQEAMKSSRDRFLRHGGAPTNNWFVAIGVPII